METLALAALTAALTLPGARAELLSLRASMPAGCTPQVFVAPRPVAASGDVALRGRGVLPTGARCEGWAWARARVLAPAAVTSRAVREGETLSVDAVTIAEREVVAGRPLLSTVPPGATAARALAGGVALDDANVRIGPAPGHPVTVLVRAGALTVEQPGRAVACGRERGCALLPSGRRVEGVFDGGRLVVEAP